MHPHPSRSSHPALTPAPLRTLAPALAVAAAVAASFAVPSAARAQSAPTDYRDQFLDHFERSSGKVVTLAEATPETLFSWSPGEGVMSVERVYAHIARYNYMYLQDNLGIPAPEGVDVANLESTTGKGNVTRLLGNSVQHVKDHVSRMSEEDLTEMTELYGQRVAGWAVLFQLLAHMNEHVGQSVAYARMNGLVPPWSR